MACSQKIEKMMIRREWETERQIYVTHMGNTMEGQRVENWCPESKLKTSLEITNIKINQLPHWMMSQNDVYIDTTN